ncbi:MAG TPA: glycoside hydrolase family 3 N-terminal domain-containing protein, partial [Oleiagrimonas sp.]|nr:glycoside hydrolase family 3 N-terminal domain-containing protein [Oleiagrimonas sp.]
LQLADAFHKASVDTSDGGVGIPLLFGFDAVHGANDVVGATLFPQNSALGATRDPELIRKIGAATAAEARAVGVNWTFAPALSVPRDDRWGRTYEGYSENPALVARYATAMVEGLQGKAGTPQFLDGSHVIASAKHYLGDGSTHNGKDQGDARISEKQLRDIAAAGYPPAINAGVQTVMASFSSWNGMKMTGSKSLLTGVLKQRMDFQGFIVGDWNAQGQLPGCTTTDCPQAINAGLDMYMAPDSWKGLYKNTLAEVKSGRIPMARLDDAVARILRVKFRLGLFEQGAPSQQALGGKFKLIGSPQHRALARRAVRESLVLLKNRNHLLPLDPDQRILVAGDGADSITKQSGGWTLTWQGTGTTRADFPNATSIWEGIRKQVQAAGGQAELAVDGHYKHKPDVAIVVYGEDPYAEYMGDIPTLDYAPNDTTDLDLLKRLHAQGIPVVSVFLTGRPLWVNREINASDAFVVAWLPGSEGEGVADVLLRKANGGIQYDFHGKLAFSWPRTAMQTPLNIGQKNYDPQFAYGYGLRYGDDGNIGHLSEVSGVPADSAASGTYLHNGTPGAGIVVQLATGTDVPPVTVTSLPATTGNDSLTVSTEDYQRQESARRLVWSGTAAYQLRADEAQNLSSQTAADTMLVVTMKINHLASGTVSFGMAPDQHAAITIPVTTALSKLPTDTWMRVGLPLQCLQRAGVDMRQIRIPFQLKAATGDAISVTGVELSTEADHTLPCTIQPN